MSEPRYFLKVELPAQELLDNGETRPQTVRAEIDDGYYPTQHLGLFAPWGGRRWGCGSDLSYADDKEVKVYGPTGSDTLVTWIETLRAALDELDRPPAEKPWEANIDVWVYDDADDDSHDDWGTAELTLESLDPESDWLTHLCIQQAYLMIVIDKEQIQTWVETFERAATILRAIHEVTSQMAQLIVQKVRANVARALGDPTPVTPVVWLPPVNIDSGGEVFYGQRGLEHHVLMRDYYEEDNEYPEHHACFLARLDGDKWEKVWIGNYCWEVFDDPQLEADNALKTAREDLEAFLADPGPDNGGWVHRFDIYGDLGPKYAAARRLDD